MPAASKSFSRFVVALTMSLLLPIGGIGLWMTALAPAPASALTERAVPRVHVHQRPVAQTSSLTGLDPVASWFSSDSNLTTHVGWGDMDGDGDLDLAVGNYNEPNKVYLNVGGMLQSTAVFSASNSRNTESIAWGDMDGDGDLDLAVGNSDQPNNIYLNVGGLLQPTPVFTASDVEATQSLAWGDMDGDGDLDLAAGNFDGPNKVYLNLGGMIQPTAIFSASNNRHTESIAWGDMDGDGDLDLATGNIDQPNNIYLNVGGLLQPTPVFTSSDFDQTRSLAWGDMDGDGDLDLAAGNYDGPNKVYLNLGGALQPTAVFSSSESDFTTSVVWGDVEGDGDLDLAAGNWGQPSKVYLNVGGMLQPSAVFSTSDRDKTQSVAWADMDGDGDLDLATGNWNQPSKVYLNLGGVLQPTTVFSSSDDLAQTRSVAWGDMDGDGDLDLAAGNSSDPNKVYLNVGGVLQPTAVFTANDSSNTQSVAWGDMDGDGDLDLAAGNLAGPNKVYRNLSGVLQPTAVFSSSDDGGWNTSVAWGDMEGDGDLDLATGNRYGPNRVYLNVGGAFQPTAVFSSSDSDYTQSVAWGDMDDDGDLDLAAGNWGHNKVYLNVGGALQSTAVFSSSDSDDTQSIAWGDMDGDGDLDLAAGNYGQPNKVYLNVGGVLQPLAAWVSRDSDLTNSVAWGDVDGDGDLDLAAGNGGGQFNKVYLNIDGLLQPTSAWIPSDNDYTQSVAWGDMDGDGDLDLATGNTSGRPNTVYLNTRDARTLPGALPTVRIARPSAQADFFSSTRILSNTIPLTYTLFDPQGDPVRAIRAWYSLNGGDAWQPAIAAPGTPTQTLGTTNFFTRAYTNTTPVSIPVQPQPIVVTSTLTVTPTDTIADVDVRLNISHTWVGDMVITLTHANTSAVLMDRLGLPNINPTDGCSADNIHTVLDDEASTLVEDICPPIGGLAYRPQQALTRFDGKSASGIWQLTIADEFPSADGGQLNAWGITVTLNSGRVYTYAWDTAASGFFGQSDDVVFRLEVVPAIVTGTKNATPGPFLYGSYASSTFPFRVRGTQVRVMNQNGTPAINALVYRLPATATVGGALMGNASAPFHTDNNGYLQGRGQLGIGDRLLALAPVLTSTQGYALYYTNGTPQDVGVDTFTVNGAGVQVITVTSQHPLYLFDVDVSLEWDAHNDANYLNELTTNLERASQYLFDFTNGQMALGDVFVYQNTAGWGGSHISIRADNRIRPFAIIGGVVTTNTVDPQHNTPGNLVEYGPGQVTIGSTWNRYGRPGQMLGDDWAVILAHELGHYLMYHDDVYLGFDGNGNLIPITTCTGSAMGDLYDRPDNTEFIFNEAEWQSKCSQTLAEQTLGRNEWETMRLWYPALVTPTGILTGPSTMPFDLTTITIFDPLTPTATLADPTFYINYPNNAVSSSDARAYLMQSDTQGAWLINLGSPIGGQNRVVANGAEPSDRLCVFDPAQQAFGCETIAFGDDQLQMSMDATWNPVVQITPVTSETLRVNVSNVPTTGLTLNARVFPDLIYAPAPITLTLSSGVYSGTFVMTQTGILNGHVQVWVNEVATETNPRRETLVAFSIGGNPGGSHAPGASRGSGGVGALRVGGGALRVGGGALRVGGGALRVGGGAVRSGHAPLLSPDGQLIFFTTGNTEFITGSLFTVQGMANLPALPSGRALVGSGYAILASPGVTLPAGSVSVQYLSNDVTMVGAREDNLTLYVYTSTVIGWRELPTTRDEYFNVLVAESKGSGVYAVFASVQIPLEALGWNLVAYPLAESQAVTTALQSITGAYSIVYGYYANDVADPWKVYATGVPTYVNDLSQLDPGRGYWISATQAITWYLEPSPPNNLQAPETPLMALPPSTFYGNVSGDDTFTPQAGMVVEARVNGVVCGKGLTQLYDGNIVYVVDVQGAGYGGPAECGATGAVVQFAVDGYRMAPAGQWTNDALTPLTLTPAQVLYLPMVMR